MSGSIAEALNSVRQSVKNIVANSQGSIISLPRVVAVSKTKPASMVMEAYDCGQRHFGENYVQEIVQKAPELPKDIQWHYIGNLQTNKAKMLLKGVPHLFMLESVHSSKLANMLNKQILALERDPLKVLVQVNVSGEDSKSGCTPETAVDLVKHIMENCPKLHSTMF